MKIVWIDDAINRESEISYFIRVKNLIESALQEKQITVAWDMHSDASRAYTVIDQQHSDIDLAIVDFEFLDKDGNKQATNADEVFRKLTELKVYFAIHTNHPSEITRASKFCVGVFDKSETGTSDLTNCVVEFLDTPPVRILQISDLHYDVRMKERDLRLFFDSFSRTILSINNEHRIDMVAICGDLSATRPAQELTLVKTELVIIFKNTIKIKEDQIFIVAGNHEVIWQDFSKRELSYSPYSGFAAFLNAFFSKSILKTIDGYHDRSIPDNVSADKLTWCREIPSLHISTIGICSNSANADEQGLGYLSSANIEFINKKWTRSVKATNEMRILIMHHNIFPVQSADSRDENRTIKNAGESLNTLCASKCDIVLSGHTHRPETVLYRSSSQSAKGFIQNNALMTISGGTNGGVAPTLDTPKTFNVIDIAYKPVNKKRTVNISPYIYESKCGEWTKQSSTSYSL